MLHIHCAGTPYEIGLKHGAQAREAILRTIDFYTWLFQDSAKMHWPQVRELALEFKPTIEKNWPAYLEEMQGIASGAAVPEADILALNVRIEITFGMFLSDGCTSLSWTQNPRGAKPATTWLAQNWDWNPLQKPNLLHLTIDQPGVPKIQMLTEAGLIGKIGLNARGVGVCLNAIKARGCDVERMPCHLGLRMVLESTSRDEAVKKLERHGIASACHMLIADAAGGVGLEWSATGVRKIEMDGEGRVVHSNHYLKEHEGVEEEDWMADSTFRVERIRDLCGAMEKKELGYEELLGMFKDEENFPGSICRTADGGKSFSATLFNIIMNLDEKRAEVCVGRPVEPDEKFVLEF